MGSKAFSTRLFLQALNKNGKHLPDNTAENFVSVPLSLIMRLANRFSPQQIRRSEALELASQLMSLEVTEVAMEIMSLAMSPMVIDNQYLPNIMGTPAADKIMRQTINLIDKEQQDIEYRLQQNLPVDVQKQTLLFLHQLHVAKLVKELDFRSK